MVAVIVRQVVDADGDAAAVAHEPAGAVDAQRRALGVVGGRGAVHLAVRAVAQRHLRADDHGRAVRVADLPGQGGRQRASLLHRQELGQPQQLGIRAAVANPGQVAGTRAVTWIHGEAHLPHQGEGRRAARADAVGRGVGVGDQRQLAQPVEGHVTLGGCRSAAVLVDVAAGGRVAVQQHMVDAVEDGAHGLLAVDVQQRHDRVLDQFRAEAHAQRQLLGVQLHLARPDLAVGDRVGAARQRQIDLVLGLRHEVNRWVGSLNRQLEGIRGHLDGREQRQDGVLQPRLLPDLRAPQVGHPLVAEAGLCAVAQLVGFDRAHAGLVNLVRQRVGIALAHALEALARAQQHVAVEHVQRVQAVIRAAHADRRGLQRILAAGERQTFARGLFGLRRDEFVFHVSLPFT